MGNTTAAKQNSTTEKINSCNFMFSQIHFTSIHIQFNLLAVNPTQRAYGITLRSQCEEANKIMVVVIHIHPMKILTKANNHSSLRSGVKHTCGLLKRVIQVHIKPNLVSPRNKLS